MPPPPPLHGLSTPEHPPSQTNPAPHPAPSTTLPCPSLPMGEPSVPPSPVGDGDTPSHHSAPPPDGTTRPRSTRCGDGERGTERPGAGAPRPGTFCGCWPTCRAWEGGGHTRPKHWFGEGASPVRPAWVLPATFPSRCHRHRCPQGSRTRGLCGDSLPALSSFAGKAEAPQPPDPLPTGGWGPGTPPPPNPNSQPIIPSPTAPLSTGSQQRLSPDWSQRVQMNDAGGHHVPSCPPVSRWHSVSRYHRVSRSCRLSRCCRVSRCHRRSRTAGPEGAVVRLLGRLLA